MATKTCYLDLVLRCLYEERYYLMHFLIFTTLVDIIAVAAIFTALAG